MKTVSLTFKDDETGTKKQIDCVIFSNKYAYVNWMTKSKYDHVNKARMLRRSVINKRLFTSLSNN